MDPGEHPDEPHQRGLAAKLNWLRARVLGANDGIVSVAAIVVGVAGANVSTAAILAGGVQVLRVGQDRSRFHVNFFSEAMERFTNRSSTP